MAKEITPFQQAMDKRGIDEFAMNALRSSVFPGATDNSILLAVDYCKSRELDIMKKPCHIVPMNVKDSKTGKYEWRDIIMPGIAEHRITASRTQCYAGIDEPRLGPTVEITIGGEQHQVPEFAIVTVYRIVEGQRVAFSNTEWFEEACVTTRDGKLNSMWRKRKRGQLIKCAEAGALRKAFPEELGGIHTAEEMEGRVIDSTAEVVETDTDSVGAAGVFDRIKEKQTAKPADAKPKSADQKIVDGEFTEDTKAWVEGYEGKDDKPAETKAEKPAEKQAEKPDPMSGVAANPIGPNKVKLLQGMLAKNNVSNETFFKLMGVSAFGGIDDADMNRAIAAAKGGK